MRTPGACDSTAHMSVALGMLVSFSASNVVPTAVVVTSTTGDSLVTVTVSCSVATGSWLSTVSVWPRRTTTPSRFTVWKPVSSNVISYAPPGSAGKR